MSVEKTGVLKYQLIQIKANPCTVHRLFHPGIVYLSQRQLFLIVNRQRISKISQFFKDNITFLSQSLNLQYQLDFKEHYPDNFQSTKSKIHSAILMPEQTRKDRILEYPLNCLCVLKLIGIRKILEAQKKESE